MVAREPRVGGPLRSGLIPPDLDGPDGGRLALLAPGLQPLTYRDLARHIDAVGTKLASLGVGPHDCVATMLPEGPDAATAFLNVANIAACAPLNPRYTKAELEFYLSDLRPVVAFVGTALDTPCREIAATQGVRADRARPPPALDTGLDPGHLPLATSNQNTSGPTMCPLR